MPSATNWMVEAGRIVRFGLVGVLATLCFAGVTYLVAEAGVAAPVLAVIVGNSVAAVVAYFGHLHFSFAVKPNHSAYVRRFAMTTALSFLVTVGTTWLMTEVFNTPYVYSIVLLVVVYPGISYLLNRFWIFEPGLTASEARATATTQLREP